MKIENGRGEMLIISKPHLLVRFKLTLLKQDRTSLS